MPRKTYKPEEIIGILRDVEIQQGQGRSIADCRRAKGISEAIYYRWKKEYGGMHPSEARRLRELEKENSRLKKLLAEVMLDNQILTAILSVMLCSSRHKCRKLRSLRILTHGKKNADTDDPTRTGGKN